MAKFHTRLLALSSLAAGLVACGPGGIPSQAGSPAYVVKQAQVRNLTQALSFSEHAELKEVGPALGQMNTNLGTAGAAPIVATMGLVLANGAGSVIANGAGSVIAGGAKQLQSVGLEPAGYSLAQSSGDVQITTDPGSNELTGLSKGGVALAFAFSGLGQEKRNWEMKLINAPDGSNGKLNLTVDAARWVTQAAADPRFRIMGGQVPDAGSVRSLLAEFEAIPQNRVALRFAGKIGVDEPKALPGNAVPQASHLVLGLTLGKHELSADLRTDGELVDATGTVVAPDDAGALQRFTYQLNFAPRTQMLKLSVDHRDSGVRLLAEGKVGGSDAWLSQGLTAGLYAIEDGVKIADLRPDPKDKKAIVIAYTDGTTFVWKAK